MKRVFVDMDGVIVDFEGYMNDHNIPAWEVKKRPNAYIDMKPIDGALEAVRQLIDWGYEVWIATKPPTGVPSAYSEKVQWILDYLPELSDRIVITHNKGFLGDEADYLCDDRPFHAECESFKGTLLRFVQGYHWPEALAFLEKEKNNS